MSLPELSDFRLVGGTALSLLRGHRESVDIDMFCDRPLNRHLIITINLLLLSIWIWIQICFFSKSKLVELLLDVSPFYSSTLWVMYFLSLLYAHFFVARKLLLNLVVTTVLFQIVHYGIYALGY
jgi:hypothetical protein